MIPAAQEQAFIQRRQLLRREVTGIEREFQQPICNRQPHRCVLGLHLPPRKAVTQIHLAALSELVERIHQKRKCVVLAVQNIGIRAAPEILFSQRGGVVFLFYVAAHGVLVGRRTECADFPVAVAERRFQIQRVAVHVKVKQRCAFLRRVGRRDAVRVVQLHIVLQLRQNTAAKGGQVLLRKGHDLLILRQQRVYLFPELRATPHERITGECIQIPPLPEEDHLRRDADLQLCAFFLRFYRKAYFRVLRAEMHAFTSAKADSLPGKQVKQLVEGFAHKDNLTVGKIIGISIAVIRIFKRTVMAGFLLQQRNDSLGLRVKLLYTVVERQSFAVDCSSALVHMV